MRLLVGTFLLTIGCHLAMAEDAVASRPNVVLILADDLRPDAIAALGNPTVHTPHLDELVRRGTVFTRAICAHPLCLPSRAELLTGCTGLTNGVHPPLVNRFDQELDTWPGTMASAGYRTCYAGKWHASGRPSDAGWQETQGLFASGGGRYPLTHATDHRGQLVTGYVGWVFQTDDRTLFPERGVGLTPTTDAAIADAAIEFLEIQREQPFFLQINFTAPHDPLLVDPRHQYDSASIPLPPNYMPEHPFDHGNRDGRDERILPAPRSPDDVRRELAAYYSVVTRMDEQVGRVLESLQKAGRSNNTIVIFASDHGLAVGSHGLRGKQNMYEHTIGVPLIFAGPGVPAGRTCGAQCYLRDLFPTVCDLVGIPIPESIEGKSLAPVLAGKKESVHSFVVGYFADSQRMIRTDRWKYVWYPRANREQLFDLLADPYERNDLSTDRANQSIRESLNKQLLDWLRQHHDPVLETGTVPPVP